MTPAGHFSRPAPGRIAPTPPRAIDPLHLRSNRYPDRLSTRRTDPFPVARAGGSPLLAVFLRGFGRLGRRRACRFGFTRSRSGSGSRDFADLVGLDPLLGGHVPSKALQTEVVLVSHGFPPIVLIGQLALPCL